MRTRWASLVFVVAAAGCGDPPLLETTLPNGYVHHSNGDHFGFIASADRSTLAQLTMQDDGSERWCNRFGIRSAWVMCEVVEYPVDSGMKTTVVGFLILDTSSGRVTEYPDQATAASAWMMLTSSPVPTLAGDDR
jgi:hypothetical protein